VINLKIKKWKKLISYYKPYKLTFFLDLFFSVVASAITILLPIILRYLTSEVIFLEYNDAISKIIMLSIGILILLIIAYGCNYYMLYCGHLIGAKIENDMRNEIFVHYQKLSHKFYDNKKVGELMSRITTDLSNISEFLHHFPEETLLLITRFLGIFIVFCMINWKLAIITTGLIPITCFYIAWFMPKMAKAFEKNFGKMAKINSQIEDSLSGIRVVKSFANEDLEIEKFKEANKNFVNSRKESLKIVGWGFSGTFTSYLFVALHIALEH
jgi:ATP-binding cassette subfamily B protein